VSGRRLPSISAGPNGADYCWISGRHRGGCIGIGSLQTVASSSGSGAAFRSTGAKRLTVIVRTNAPHLSSDLSISPHRAEMGIDSTPT